MKNNRFAREITVFHGRTTPETGRVAGYAAIIDALELPVPLPSTIGLIGKNDHRYEKDGWKVFKPKLETYIYSRLKWSSCLTPLLRRLQFT